MLFTDRFRPSWQKRSRVFVHGTVITEAWTDKETGDKRDRTARARRDRRAEPALGHHPNHQEQTQPDAVLARG